jgi:hypothetical protein
MLAAGPASGVAVVLLGVRGVGDDPSAMALGVTVVAAWTVLANLTPFNVKTPAGEVPTDGLPLVSLLLPKTRASRNVALIDAFVRVRKAVALQDTEESLLAMRAVGEELDDPKLVATADALSTVSKALARRTAGSASEALQQCDELGLDAIEVLEGPALVSGTNLYAWLALLAGDEQHLQVAEAALAIAVAESGDVHPPEVEDTKAWIDLRRGRPEEAHRRFSRAYSTKAAAKTRGLIALGLAAASAALGDETLAAAWRTTPAKHAIDPVHGQLPPHVVGPVARPEPWPRTELDRAACAGRAEAWVEARHRRRGRRFAGLRWTAWALVTVVAVAIGAALVLASDRLDPTAVVVGVGLCGIVALTAVPLGVLAVLVGPRLAPDSAVV